MSDGYLPDTRRRIERSTRFFARLVSFDVECPHCGDVYSVRLGAARKRTGRKQADPNWDPWTARFTCTNKRCQKKYVLGILAWPVLAAPHVASMPPKDQIPHPRQLAGLRREGGGWWLPDEDAQRYPQPHETNLTMESERPEDHGDDDEE